MRVWAAIGTLCLTEMIIDLWWLARLPHAVLLAAAGSLGCCILLCWPERVFRRRVAGRVIR